MATFDEVQFPANISVGARGGPTFNTTIVELASGSEQRNINWSRERPEYDVSTGMKTADDVRAYQRFFYARRGKAIGFRFKDWSDYRLPFFKTTPGDRDALPTLFTTNGATATFQIYKVYTDAGGTFSRKIVKIVTGKIALFNNAVVMVDPTNYTVDLNTGIVTLSGAVAATTGRLITGWCEFDVPARFDTDKQNVTLNGNEIMIWDSVPIIGLKL